MTGLCASSSANWWCAGERRGRAGKPAGFRAAATGDLLRPVQRLTAACNTSLCRHSGIVRAGRIYPGQRRQTAMSRTTEEAAKIPAIVAQDIQCHASGAIGQAERLYNQVLAAAPSHAIASYNLALLLIESGRLRAARARLLSLVKAQPRDGAANYTLAKVFQAEGALTKSLFHFRRAIDLEPDRLETYLELIAIYGRLGRLDDARQTAASATARFPGQAEVPTKFALVLVAAGLLEEAKRLFGAALAANPNH